MDAYDDDDADDPYAPPAALGRSTAPGTVEAASVWSPRRRTETNQVGAPLPKKAWAQPAAAPAGGAGALFAAIQARQPPAVAANAEPPKKRKPWAPPAAGAAAPAGGASALFAAIQARQAPAAAPPSPAASSRPAADFRTPRPPALPGAAPGAGLSPALRQCAERNSSLKARRQSLSPEQKDRLLRDEGHVMGAALSLHIVHDVPLDDVGARLLAAGVDEDLAQRAMRTVREKLVESFSRNGGAACQLAFHDADAEEARRVVGAPRAARRSTAFDDDEPFFVPSFTAPPAPPAVDGDEAALAKYRKMLAVGVPFPAAVAAAERDKVEPRLIALLCGGADSPPPPPAAAVDDDVVKPYKKMLAMGVPPAAVREKMAREGRSVAEIGAVVGDDKAPAEAKARGAPTPRRVKSLHWEKLEGDVSTTVWASPSGLASPPSARKPAPRSRASLDFGDAPLVCADDLALLEEIFATAQPKKTLAKTPKKRSKSRGSDADDSSGDDGETLKKVSILQDARRAANVAIGLSYFSRRFGDEDQAVCRAVVAFDDWLDAERLRSLKTLLPTTEEASAVQNYLDEVLARTGAAVADDALARPERFFRATLRWPTLEAAIEAGILRAEVDEAAWAAKACMRHVQRACEAIKDSSSLATVLRTLLKLGNKMNEGVGHLEQAKGINLSSLSRFASAKGRDDMTLIDYLASLLEKKRQLRHLDFVDHLPSLDEARRSVDEEKSAGTAKRLRTQLAQLKALVPKHVQIFLKVDAAASELERGAMASEDGLRRGATAKTSWLRTSAAAAPAAVQPAASLERASLERAALHRFFIEAERAVSKATTSVSSLDTALLRLAATKRDLLAYFGEAEGASVADVFSSLQAFATEVSGARDKLRKKQEGRDRAHKQAEARLQRDRRRSAVAADPAAPVREPQTPVASRRASDDRDGAADARAKATPHPTAVLRPNNQGAAGRRKSIRFEDEDEPEARPKSRTNLALSKCRNALKKKQAKQQELHLLGPGSDGENGSDGERNFELSNAAAASNWM
ncbi:hypothetical protein M885DRAFT_584882 [Pelagophyceae sp. CCMP2097]|nr:hypothetical protein M885DRAFT_584882 [Pelagophyceae sp. CCMP2097]